MNNEKELISEVRKLEFTARRLWPFLRVVFRKHLSRRCSRCICSEQYADIGEDGLCSMCREHGTGESGKDAGGGKAGNRMQQELDDILRQYEDREGTGYDALVCFSGGKDSTYLLYRLKKEYPGLRLLAFTVDNNFMSPVALDNVTEIISRLDIAHVLFKPRLSFSLKMFRYAFTHLNENGCSGTVDQFDGDSIFDMARTFAAQQGIPLVIGGISPHQVEYNVGIHSFETPAETEARKREYVAGLRLEDIFDEQDMIYWWDGTRWAPDRIPRVIFPFYAWGYSETEIKREVVRLGLMPEGMDSPLLTNNQLIPLMALVDNARLGYSSFEPEFSKLVRQGKAEKHFWRNVFEMAEYSGKTGRFIKKSVDDILTALGLSRKDVGLTRLTT